MQPHTGAIATLVAQFQYDIGDQYYRVECKHNHREYSITLADVYRRQLIFRVGNIYPCYTRVELELGDDFTLQSKMDGKKQVNYIPMARQSIFRIVHSHTNVEERFELEVRPNIPNIVWISDGKYTKEIGWKAWFDGRYELDKRTAEIIDVIDTGSRRIEDKFEYRLP